MPDIFLQFSFADSINQFVSWLVREYGDLFHQLTAVLLTTLLVPLEQALLALPPLLVLLTVAVLCYHGTRRKGVTALMVAGLYLIGCLGLWDKLMQTLALMVVATVLTMLVGVPLGIMMSRSQRLRWLLVPVLDVMQTLPTFVYLIPVLMLFGLGKVPAIFATVIYALPPLVRLTDLGIRQVDGDLLEAARSFGTTRWQLLFGVQLPLARPSIMAGVNQSIMMALAMVVIASMIGSRGLGEDVLAGINNMDMGKGMQSGLAIVILAIVIDRISQAYGQDGRLKKALRLKKTAGATA
ncbi:ABC transporter permease [Aquitalea magnusonii]|uniref:Glycine betaine/proline transport system permease protein n=1 Tax=Aquitalea magnusonii TaxID=332411 RepID=A0A318JLL3_9NEIS|nr:proline/glycine betaine ABC transporter permease [Aquitalea magnusonii]PXX50623.1 glycine betaine/proline transport system permease protein [Aquitalea magnusonii]